MKKIEKVGKKHNVNGILLLKIALTASWPGVPVVSSFTLRPAPNKPHKFNNTFFEKKFVMQVRNEPMAKIRPLNSRRDAI